MSSNTISCSHCSSPIQITPVSLSTVVSWNISLAQKGSLVCNKCSAKSSVKEEKK